MAKEIDPRMHSAEHILNQTMMRMFSCGRCFNAHIERKKSKCDYHFARALRQAEVRKIERHVNDVILAGMVVTEEYLSKEAAQRRYDTGRLPEDAGNEVRVVKIGDYDACPCIGAHVKSTKEIGRFKISSVSFENNVLRIRFKLD